MATTVRENFDSQDKHRNADEIDDLFDSLVMSEERFQEEGHKDGKEAGSRIGYEQGFVKGASMGRMIGSEIGFYKGFVTGLRTMLGEEKNIRKLKALSALSDLVEKFPLTDANYEDLIEELEKIRAKFKQVSSLFHIQAGSGGGITVSYSF